MRLSAGRPAGLACATASEGANVGARWSRPHDREPGRPGPVDNLSGAGRKPATSWAGEIAYAASSSSALL